MIYDINDIILYIFNKFQIISNIFSNNTSILIVYKFVVIVSNNFFVLMIGYKQ